MSQEPQKPNLGRFGSAAEGEIPTDGRVSEALVNGIGVNNPHKLSTILGREVSKEGGDLRDIAAATGAVQITRIQESPALQTGEGPKEGEVPFKPENVHSLY